jgi:hypothetical protein
MGLEVRKDGTLHAVDPNLLLVAESDHQSCICKMSRNSY